MTDPQDRPDETAQVESSPDNVVKDNTGQVPVQPVGTSDPTITDNTNPRVPFDGADPRNIPPHDSNEQLHIGASKRFAAESSNLEAAAEQRRSAVSAAYMNEQDVQEVMGVDEQDRSKGQDQAAAELAARARPPQGRTTRQAQQSTTTESKPTETGSGSSRSGSGSGGGKS